MRQRAGFTLLEIMASMAILTVVMGMLFALARGLNASASEQEAKLTSQDQARVAMDYVARQLRQAAASSITGALPGPAIYYQTAEDTDGNGSAVDLNGNIELSPVRCLQRDVNDVNRDGRTLDQLVMVTGGTAHVVTNGLLPDEDTNGNGVLDAGEDTNHNGILDHGLWFERVGQGIRVTIQCQHQAGPGGVRTTSTLVETVVPRN